MAVIKIWKVKDRLDITIDYAINGEKTEEKLYVSGINCMLDTALQEMKNTKKQYFKTEGIQCFHGVQSFVKGEVTPEQAHRIGIELAKELWGDRFQVIVTTHLNTDNLHNHFVLNSVSFLDGKRFYNTKKDYAIMRKVSDRLCGEYGLNVLKQEEKYNKYATSSLYKELMKGSIAYLIFQYEKLLGINTENVLKLNIMRRTPELIVELKKMDEFSNQAKFLAKHNINTEQELLDFEKGAYEKVNPLKSKRENLWKKRKRAKTDEQKQEIENEIIDISKEITPLTEEIKHCNNIMQRMEKIKQYQEYQKLQEEKKQFEKEQDKKKKDKNRAR